MGGGSTALSIRRRLSPCHPNLNRRPACQETDRAEIPANFALSAKSNQFLKSRGDPSFTFSDRHRSRKQIDCPVFLQLATRTVLNGCARIHVAKGLARRR